MAGSREQFPMDIKFAQKINWILTAAVQIDRKKH